MAEAQYSRVIFAASLKHVQEDTIAVAWSEAFPVFRTYFNKWICAEASLESAIRSGLPYHFPFSIETYTANSFAQALREKGWRVTVVPSEFHDS